jgi:hypothetical protein
MNNMRVCCGSSVETHIDVAWILTSGTRFQNFEILKGYSSPVFAKEHIARFCHRARMQE